MATGWLQGRVKEVVSGDTVVVQGLSKAGSIPPEKRITLSSLIAPKLGRRDGSSSDEAFAWPAREFLRKKYIGQACTFRVDYTLEAVPGREFGSIFCGSDNLARSVVAAGWAKVRSSGGQQSPFYAELEAAQSAAEASGLGIWSKDSSAMAKAIRNPQAEVDAATLLQQMGKGCPVPAIVEQVASGSSMRLTLLPDLQSVFVGICGVTCPSMGRRPPPTAAAAAGGGAANGTGHEKQESAAAAVAAPAGDASATTPQPEPFAREAKHFTETKCLGQEVRAILEGVDKFGNLFVQIMYSEGDKPDSLSEQLVRLGLGKLVNWGVEMMTQGAFTLREAERSAKGQKLRIWQNYTPPASAGTKLADDFTGKVVEVVSGDCLVVKESASGVERRVNLSSLRAPRMGRKGERPETYATEAKEFLRQRLIGKEVAVSMEYTRKVPVAGAGGPAPGGAPAADNRDMAFATVTTKGKEGAQGGSNNVAELMLLHGLASIVRHRTDDERSAHYEALLQAEQKGRSSKKGLYSSGEPPVHHLNDVSLPGTAAKAKQYLPFFQRGRHNAVVEFVLSGSRLKLYIPKEGVCIAFSPSGLRTPQRAMSGSAGRAATQAEPFCDEALAFTREHCLQREVQIEIETMDRGGTFLGKLTLNGPRGSTWDLGLSLLEAGLGKLHPSFDADRVAGGRALQQAQEKAQSQRLKVWQKWEPSAEDEGDAQPQANGHSAELQEQVVVSVTEVISGSMFYAQMAKEPRLAFLREQLQSLPQTTNGAGPALQTGALCVAQFQLDKQWYRARVERIVSRDPVNPKYQVMFIDFGNRDQVAGNQVRAIDPSLAAVPAQAHPCKLAYLKVPSPEDDFGTEAAQLLAELSGGGKELNATIVQRERSATKGQPAVLHLVLYSGEAKIEHSVNAEMVSAGLAKLLARVKAGPARTALEECEAAAKKAHRGIFEYGDAPDSDDDL